MSWILRCLLLVAVAWGTSQEIPAELSSDPALPTSDSGEQSNRRLACHMQSPDGRVRILLPFNESAVTPGTLLVVQDRRWASTFRPGSAHDRTLTVSIDGLEWLSVPSRSRALQLPLPSSLPPGPHVIRVSATPAMESREDMSADPASDPPEESACVCVSVRLKGRLSEDDQIFPRRARLEIKHPPPGAWVSSAPVSCPLVAFPVRSATVPAGPVPEKGSEWVPCLFALDASWTAEHAGIGADAGVLKPDPSATDPSFGKDYNATDEGASLGAATCTVGRARLLVDGAPYWQGVLATDADGDGSDSRRIRNGAGRGACARSGRVYVPIGPLPEGWRTLTLEVCYGLTDGSDCGDQKVTDRDEVHVEVMPARSAARLCQQVRTVDGVSAALARASISVLHPQHASVYGPGGQGESEGWGGGGLHVLVRVDGAALGAGSAAIALRLDGRLLPAGRTRSSGGIGEEETTGQSWREPRGECLGQWLWWVRGVDAAFRTRPWHSAPVGRGA